MLKPNKKIVADTDDADDAIDQWAARITQAWQKAVASIVKVGRLLIQAQEDLGYGRFGQLFEDGPPFELLPFGWRTANRLMAIARHPVLSDSTRESRLPPSWATLYILSRIPADRLKRLIGARKVHAGMMRKDAARLVSGVPDRVIRAIEDLTEAMAESDVATLAAEVRKALDDGDEDWSFHRQCHPGVETSPRFCARRPLHRLHKLPAWIAELHDALERAEAAND